MIRQNQDTVSGAVLISLETKRTRDVIQSVDPQ